MRFNKILVVLIFGTLIVGGLFSLPGNSGSRVLSAQFSQAIHFRLPNFFSGIDWFQVLANILNPQDKNTPNACKVGVDDVFTLDNRYTLHWNCTGDSAPCTVYANGKVFSQVHGVGSIRLTMKQVAIIYSIRNRNNLPCTIDIAHQFQTSGPTGSVVTPVITSISPSSASVGDVSFIMTITGTDFQADSVVQFAGSNRTTTFVNPTHLTASIPSSDLTVADSFNIAVFNPSTGLLQGFSNNQTFSVGNAVPTISGISPNSKITGDASFTITVNGTNFISGSVVDFAGSARTTTFVNSGQLTATILAADLAVAGSYGITVVNPAPGGGTSGSQTLSVNNSSTTLSDISPTSRNVGGADFTLTVNGTGFISTTVVNFNGSARTTTFVSSTQLTATITSADIATAGSYNITATTPPPGGGTSNAITLTVNNPTPVTTSISPTSKTAGDSAFTLTVNGSSFVSGSTVRFAGSNRTTTYINATQLTAAIPSSDLTSAGTFNITVFNATPGGGTSNAQTFTVNAAPRGSSLTHLTYADPDSFQSVLEAHLALWDGSSLATTTIITNETAASSTMRTAVDDILSATNDGSLSASEETTLVSDSSALTALGHGYEIIKVSVTSTGENFLWIRDNDGTQDTDGMALFRVSGYGTITGGGKSQQLVTELPHRYDDTNTVKFGLREFLNATKTRALVSTYFNRDRINATGTGSASSLTDDIATATCTGIEGRGGLVANDKGLYYIYNQAGGAVNDYLYFVPYTSGPACPPVSIIHATGSPKFDSGSDLDFVNSRRIIAADNGLEEFWCQDLASDGTASGSPVVTAFVSGSFNADVVATTPDGKYLFVIDDPNPNVEATDSNILRFSIDSSCNLSAKITIASSRGEIDGMKVDAFGNLIFVEDDINQNRTDVKYINNAQGGATTIATLVKGDSAALPNYSLINRITTDALTISSPGVDGHGDGNILIYEAGSDAIYTIVPTRDSSGLITGLNYVHMSDFADITSNSVRGMAIQPGTTHGKPETLWIMNRDSSKLGSIYSINYYNNEVPIDADNQKDVPKLMNFQTMTTEIARKINAIVVQWHGYSPSAYPSIAAVCGSIHPVAASDGLASTTSKDATFSYMETSLATAFSGYNSCAPSVDFVQIAPTEQIASELTASTNKQCDEICVLNSVIGYDGNDDFIHFEFPTEMRISGTLNVSGSDLSTRLRTFTTGL